MEEYVRQSLGVFKRPRYMRLDWGKSRRSDNARGFFRWNARQSFLVLSFIYLIWISTLFEHALFIIIFSSWVSLPPLERSE